jgi:hypothetical protein
MVLLKVTYHKRRLRERSAEIKGARPGVLLGHLEWAIEFCAAFT